MTDCGPTYYSSAQSANAFLIQFNSAVPQQVLALPAQQERRYLSSEQEVWLMQFVAKDFLNLSNFGGMSDSGTGAGGSGYGATTTVDGSSFSTNPISEASGGTTTNSAAGSQRPGYANHYREASAAAGGGASSDPTDGDRHWLKAVAIEQLNVTATTLYFTFSQEDDHGQEMRHSFAVVITTPFAPLGNSVALRAIWDRLTHMHARVMSIFFNRDGDDYASSPTNPQGGAGSGAGGAGGGGNPTDAGYGYQSQPPMGIVGTVGGGGGYRPNSNGNSGRNDYYDNGDFDAAAAVTEAEAEVMCKTRVIATSSTAHNANAASSEADVIHQYDTTDETAGYNDIWARELQAAIADITVWVNGAVERSAIPLQRTLIGELRRCASFQSVARSSRMCDWFEQILSLALSEHRLVIAGEPKDREFIEQLLNTLALFLPDDRLLMASTRCHNGFVVPDLSFQGTTLPMAKIKSRLVWFRYPVAVVDVSRMALLDRPVHFLPTREGGKKVYAVFREWRRDQITCRRNKSMAFMRTDLVVSRLVSPIAQTIARRFLNFIGFPTAGLIIPYSSGSKASAAGGGVGGAPSGGSADKQQKGAADGNLLLRGSAAAGTLMVKGHGGGGGGGGGPSSQLPASFGNATSYGAEAAPPAASLMSNTAAATTTAAQAQALGSASVNQYPSLTLASASVASASVGSSSAPHGPFRRPLLGEEKGLVGPDDGPAAGYPRPFYDALMFMLYQWRRTMTFRSLAFFESEIKMDRDGARERPAPMRLADGDLHVLLACVEQIFPVGVALEERAQKDLMANFDF